MIKRYVAFLAGVLCFSLITYAQPVITVSGGSADPGSKIDINFTVDDFTEYLSLQFSINWDETVLEFSDLKNLTTDLPQFTPSLFGTHPANVDNGIITLSWLDPLAEVNTLDDGTLLFTVEFNVIGDPCDESLVAITGTPTEIEVGNADEENVGLTSIDGMFNIPGTNCGEPSGFEVTAGSTSAESGSNVCIPFTIEGTSGLNLGSLQFTINYDPTVLSFTGIQNLGLPGLNAGNFNTEQTASGLISMVWFDQGGFGVEITNGMTIFEVCFDVIGSGGQSSPITFSDDIVNPEAADGESNVVDLSLNNGNVSVTGSIDGFAFIFESVSTGEGEVCVDVTVNDFILITSMQGTVTWNPDVLAFDHFENLTNIPDLSASSFFQSAPGVMNLVWLDNTTAGVTVDDETVIFTLCFETLDCVSSIVTIGSQSLELNVSDTMNDDLDVTVIAGTVDITCEDCGFNFTVTNPLCPGDENGTIDIEEVNAGGCPSPITYQWSHGPATQDVTGLAAGCYDVTIMVGSPVEIHILENICLEDPDPIVASATITDAENGNDGMIDLTVTGGTMPYNYIWMPGGFMTQDISNLTPGEFSVTITDNNGCVVEAGPYLVGPTGVVADITHACDGDDGAIDLSTVQCGPAPHSYAWSPDVGNTEDISGLSAGQYCVTVTDNEGGTCTGCFEVLAADEPLDVDVDVTHEDQGCDGSILLDVSGGQSPYSYAWSDSGPAVPNRNNICAGEYTVTITDQLGCQIVETIFVVGDELAVIVQTSDNNGFAISCAGNCDGTAFANVLNAVGNVTYAWSSDLPPAQAQNNLCAGVYSVTVTDEASQTATATVNINSPTPLVLELDVECASEPGVPDGSACVSVNGGVPPYNYLWSDAGGTTTPCIQNQLPGQLVLFVQDDNDCEFMQNVEICISGIQCYEAISVITPNGDGMNDRFVIQCIYDYPTRLSVYETYRGGLEFQMTNYDNSWQGTNMDGDPLPDGGYHWVLEVMLPNNDTRIYQGTITILRKLY